MPHRSSDGGRPDGGVISTAVPSLPPSDQHRPALLSKDMVIRLQQQAKTLPFHSLPPFPFLQQPGPLTTPSLVHAPLRTYYERHNMAAVASEALRLTQKTALVDQNGEHAHFGTLCVCEKYTCQPRLRINYLLTSFFLSPLLLTVNTVHKAVVTRVKSPMILPPKKEKIQNAGGVRLNKFVRRLHDMLANETPSGVVEWRRGLLVLRNTSVFAKQILPQYFNTLNFKTFRRQLNYYGFVHVRSFNHSTSSSSVTTTALWVNRELAQSAGTDDLDNISSVLRLKRVEPCESVKTVEGRRARKELALSTIEVDLRVSTTPTPTIPPRSPPIHCVTTTLLPKEQSSATSTLSATNEIHHHHRPMHHRHHQQRSHHHKVVLEHHNYNTRTSTALVVVPTTNSAPVPLEIHCPTRSHGIVTAVSQGNDDSDATASQPLLSSSTSAANLLLLLSKT